jgi:GrpB-like predicted nucleotidyltransferase (UPF0157 family)
MSEPPADPAPSGGIPPIEFDEREVVLYPYDAAWPGRYERWRALILEACGEAIVEIHHIGSTSVPGMLAKPVIDIMPGLARFEDGREMVAGMEGLGFEARGEYGIPLRHYFHRPDVHVHAYPVGQSQWWDQLLFRDYLRGHAEAREAYAALKEELRRSFRFDRVAFSDHKSEFVAEVLAKARADRADG